MVSSQFFGIDLPGRHFAVVCIVVRMGRRFDRHRRLMMQCRLLRRNAAGRSVAPRLAVGRVVRQFVAAPVSVYFHLIKRSRIVKRRVAFPCVLRSRRPRHLLVDVNRVLETGTAQEFHPLAFGLGKTKWEKSATGTDLFNERPAHKWFKWNGIKTKALLGWINQK